jgi:hypothetical protein
MINILRKISGRMPVAKDILPWLQKEVYPLLVDLRDSFNSLVNEYNLAIAGKQNFHGFENRTDSSIAYSSGPDVFQITPGPNGYSFWFQGEKVTRTSIEYVYTIPSLVQYFIYFKKTVAADGSYTFVLTGSTTQWDFYQHIPVALLYKAANGTLLYEERHGYLRNIDWHAWAHSTIGAKWVSGYPSAYNNTSFLVDAGSMRDEDILASSADGITTCALLYYNSTYTGMFCEFGATTPYKAIAGALQWDNVGTLTPVSSGNYINSWVYATTNPTYPIHIVVGKMQYATDAACDADPIPTLAFLGSVEYAPIWRLRYFQNGANINYDGREDLRGKWGASAVSGGGGGGTTPSGTGWRHVTAGVEDGTASTPTKADVGLGSVVNADTTTTASIADALNKRFCTDAEKTIISNTSGVNSGNETVTTIKAALGITTLSGSNTGDQTISITGDVTAAGSTGTLSSAVTKINGTSLAGLATGILKNTTATGVPSIAVSGTDFKTVNGTSILGSGNIVAGAGSVPTGTGWRHVTAGVEDAAATTPTASEVGLGSVTNDVQTKAAVMPNTAPAAGRIPVGNAGGTAYAPVAVSGDVALTSAGVATVAQIHTTGSQIITFAGPTATRAITLPDANTTVPNISQLLTISGATAARTITVPDANFTVARTDAANTFTGVQTMTSPSLTTPAIGAATGTSLAVTGAITSSGGTGSGVGYATGAGGTTTQATSKSTSVTLSKLCGTITMNGAALAADTTVSFTLTNTFVAATDFVAVQHASAGTLGAYNFAVAPASGSVVISVRNINTASLSEAIVLRFVVIKAVTA